MPGEVRLELERIKNKATGPAFSQDDHSLQAIGDGITALISAVGNEAMKGRQEAADIGDVEEGGKVSFLISIYDVTAGKIVAANIGLPSVTLLEKSTGGGGYSSVGITQPVFAKTDGQILAEWTAEIAEWEVGDIGRLTVSGHTALIGSDTRYFAAIQWVFPIKEALGLQQTVDAIETQALAAWTDLEDRVGEEGDTIIAEDGIHAKLGTQAELAGESVAKHLVDTEGKVDTAITNIGTVNGKVDIVDTVVDGIAVSLTNAKQKDTGPAYAADNHSLQAIGDDTDAILSALAGGGASSRVAGKPQVIEDNHTGGVDGGNVTIFTVTAQPVVLDYFIVFANDDASLNFDDLLVQVVYPGGPDITLIARQLLTRDKISGEGEQVSGEFKLYLPVGAEISINSNGSGLDVHDLQLIAGYHAVNDGGYLA